MLIGLLRVLFLGIGDSSFFAYTYMNHLYEQQTTAKPYMPDYLPFLNFNPKSGPFVLWLLDLLFIAHKND